MHQSEFVSVTLINEQLKQIVGLSRRVYVTALNAMLLSRRIDSKASGFSSVTRELQQFSKQLTEQVDRVEVDINRMIADSAQSVKALRIKQLFDTAINTAGMGLSMKQKHASLLAMQRRVDQVEANKHASSHQLQLTLNKLQQQYGIGSNLSVLAKIESSMVGQFTREIAAITSQIENVMNDIQACVDKAILIQSEVA